MGRVTVCAEADFQACEDVHKLECGIFTRTPCSPDAEGGLANIDVARTTAAGPVASVDAIAANQTVQARFDRFHGINGFD